MYKYVQPIDTMDKARRAAQQWGPLQEVGGSVDVAEVAGWLPVHAAQVVHGSVKGDPHGLPDAGVPPFHHFQLVYCLINTKGNHFGLREPLPASLVVKEEDKEKPLVSPGLHALARLQHGQRRGRDGDPVVVARHTWHLGVDDQRRVRGVATALGPHDLQGLKDGGRSISGNPHAVLPNLGRNPGRLGVVAVLDAGYQRTAVLQRVPPHQGGLAPAALGCAEARVAKRAAAGGEAGLRGAASSGRSPRARGAAQLLLTPCAPKAIGETCVQALSRGPLLHLGVAAGAP